jgi:hypothetical protein
MVRHLAGSAIASPKEIAKKGSAYSSGTAIFPPLTTMSSGAYQVTVA